MYFILIGAYLDKLNEVTFSYPVSLSFVLSFLFVSLTFSSFIFWFFFFFCSSFVRFRLFCSWSFLYCSFLAFVDFNLVLILLSRVFLIAFLLVIALLICHCSLLLCSFLPIHAIGIRLWDACWRLTKSLSLAASAIKKLEFGFLEHWLLAYFMHFRLL